MFGGSRSSGGSSSQNTLFTRQATILRKNLLEWDYILRTPASGQDWTSMLGRLNAASNQSINLDKSIDDVLDHFVYLPKKATANAQDIPFFLSTRLEENNAASSTSKIDASKRKKEGVDDDAVKTKNKKKRRRSSVKKKKPDPAQELAIYENEAARIAVRFETTAMPRF